MSEQQPDTAPARRDSADLAPADPGQRRTIATLPTRLRELGRIRLGHRVPTGDGRRRPAALDSFRLTSSSRPLLDAAARQFGGTVEEWPGDDSPDRWQLTTDVDVLEVLVPPTASLEQAFELYRAGGCHRRCDGLFDEVGEQPCQCPEDPEKRQELAADGKACKPTTRLSVVLPSIPDLGVWRLDCHGFYAAVELAGTAWILDRAAAAGKLLAARLRIDHREIKRPGDPPKRFVVPVLELPVTLGQVLDATGNADELVAGPLPAAALEAPAGAGQRPAVTAGDAGHHGAPAGDAGGINAAQTVHEQLQTRIAEAGIPDSHLHALLAARYDATTLDELDDRAAAAMLRTVLTDAGMQRLRTAASQDAARDQLARCEQCGQPAEELDDDGACPSCAVPF